MSRRWRIRDDLPPPALGSECPECGAGVGKQCVATVSMPGTCVSAGLRLTGVHRARVDAHAAGRRNIS